MIRPHGCATRGYPLLLGLALVGFGLALMLHVSVAASTAQSPESATKRVLLISTGSRLAPGFIIVDRQILQALATISSPRIEIYAENFDLVHFRTEPSLRLFNDYLAAKYAERPPDLVILVSVGHLGVSADALANVFPDTPSILAGLTEEELGAQRFGKRVTGLAQRFDARAALELIDRLQPEVRRVVVIGGTAEVDRQTLQRVRDAAPSLQDRIAIDFWDDLPVAEVRRSVTALPADTAILFTRMFRDVTGQGFVSAEVGLSIAGSANVPVYVLTDASLGTGAVGGAVASIEALGTRAGELARLILTGTPPESLPFEIRTDSVPIFDWRALKRWGIDESLLPPNSVVRFKPQSIWEQYHWYIVAALAVIVVQSTMIVAFAVQRRRMRQIQAVLRESRQLVELATGAAEVGLWSRDPFRGEMWANAPMRKLFGFGAQQILRIDDMMARIHPDDRDHLVGELERAQAAGLPFEIEYRIRLPSGAERWVLAKGRTMNQLGGRDPRRMGVVMDITERKRAEAQFRESEDRLRRLVESTRVVIWQADPETWVFTYVSPHAEQLLGYPLAQWYEKDFWLSHIHPDDRMRAIETCLTMSKTAEDFDFEYRMIHASGEAVWIHDLVNCQHQDGRMQLRGLIFDITERKRSEQALRQTVTDLERAEESLEKQRTFLRQVIDVNPNFIFAKDREGHFTLANRAVAEAYGVSVDELIGKTDADFNTNAEEVEFFRRMDRQVMDTLQERFIPEERVTDARGKVHWLQTVKRPIIESDGSARQVLGTSTDITQRKQTEMELQQLRAELAHVARVSLMGELAASLAHELNQPLTAILSNASAAMRTLSRGPVDPQELREILQDIVEANNRAADVIRHMRALVKKEETLDFESLDLADLIGDVAALVHNDAVMQDIRIDLDVAVDLPRIRGDRVQLQQVVLNLLLNAFDAVKAAPAGEWDVRLRAERSEGGMNLVAVSDRGSGLSSEDLDKVFQPFYTTKREGLGMGLSICRSIIEAHGGTLRAENNRDGGATFYFTVPIETAAGTD